MDRLMEKLALSKAIMDKADGIKSSNSMNGGLPPTSLQQFDVPNAKYNIPSEFLQEGPSQQTQYLSSVPRENTKPVGNPTVVFLVLLIGGIQLICLGIIGQYIGRIYDEVKRRPRFIVSEVIGDLDTK